MIAIDLGSNTLRCVEYDCTLQKAINSFEAVVKTADGVHENRFINAGAVARVVRALQDAKKKLDFQKNEVYAVTTAAMRMAQNADEVLEKIFHSTGIRFKIISGKVEAELTILAVKKRLERSGFDADSFVLVDIGGGSTEITFCEKEKLTTQSFDVGIVTITQSCSTKGELEALLNTYLQPIKTYIDSYYETHQKPSLFVQTAGTPTTMAAFLQGMNSQTYEPSKINGYELQGQSCDTVMEKLLAMSKKQRAFYVGAGREDLILSGIAIVKRVFALLGFSSSIVIDDSLREGLAYAFCERQNLT
jgi:exopolyphosphatase / guanosine-5'-triphosphate,3'-diphosphate pyrophosphatase